MKTLKLFIIVSLISLFQAQAQKPVYTSASALTLVGKIIPTKVLYHRIDSADYPDIPPAVKKLLTNSAGLAVAFKTNSTAVSAKWCTSSRKAGSNMTGIATEGLDLYIKKDGKWQFAGVGRPGNNDCTEYTLVKNMDNSMKECLLYLPLYDETKNLEIGVDPGSSLKPISNPFQKRILIYGSSILQGASASRPGLAYPACLSRETGLNFLNLGLSGSAKMEKAVADMIVPIQADAYILDCVPNSSPQEITERTAYLVNAIRQHHPKAPIIVVQTIIREHGYFDQAVGKRVKEQNENIKTEVEKLQKAGVKDLFLILGDDLLGNDHEGTADGTHPNDLGFDRMLLQLKPKLEAILSGYGIFMK